MSTTLLSARSVRFAWPGAAPLALPDLTVHPGERWLLEGPSGAGKSTLLQLLSGVLLADAGEVALLGRPWREFGGAARDARRADHIGLVFQMFNLVPYLSALANVLLPCRFSARRRARALQRGATLDAEAQRLLAALGLDDVRLVGRAADRLSVGQQQRVAAARALIGAPELILADEPTSALDEDNRRAFLDLLFAEAQAAGAAVVVVSHDAALRPWFERRLRLGEAGSGGHAGTSVHEPRPHPRPPPRAGEGENPLPCEAGEGRGGGGAPQGTDAARRAA
ncbi:MAG: ATP-binding cassette domain-containing protein [Burkholderiales bacterium]|jgi:putative ABC transport system ATP-binding protein|nr:ATP-binding cassette domain-containing protein [Burkholderiales bacterium]